jgi:hypothetical protein
MPRRATTIEREVPLYLIAHFIQREVRTNGEDLERLIIRKTHRHFYNISMRTRPINRELRGRPPGVRAGSVQLPKGGMAV